jgi:hypothetical protein
MFYKQWAFLFLMLAIREKVNNYFKYWIWLGRARQCCQPSSAQMHSSVYYCEINLTPWYASIPLLRALWEGYGSSTQTVKYFIVLMLHRSVRPYGGSSHPHMLRNSLPANALQCCNWASRHEGVLGYGGIAPLILWPRHWIEVSGQLHAPAALLPGKEPPALFGQEAGCDPEPVWTRWWRVKFPAPTPDHPGRSPSSCTPMQGTYLKCVRWFCPWFKCCGGTMKLFYLYTVKALYKLCTEVASFILSTFTQCNI